jgi:hypothetical protein
MNRHEFSVWFCYGFAIGMIVFWLLWLLPL